MKFRLVAIALYATCLLLAGTMAAQATTLLLRTGDGVAVGSVDPNVTFIATQTAQTPFPSAFSASDFAAAQSSSAHPTVVAPFPDGWLSSLPSDPSAQWVAFDSSYTPRSMLMAYTFDVASPIGNATLDFNWAVDDLLGDDTSAVGATNPGGPNPYGLYINGQAVPESEFTGSSGGLESSLQNIDISSLLVPGTNTLYVYVRDTAGVASGIIYSASVMLPEPGELALLAVGLVAFASRELVR